jgi:hypothetical protein
MEPLKLKILNQFGAPQALKSPDDIEVVFPYEHDSLVKKMSYGHVKVLNDAKGEIEVTLTPFDIQGMPTKENQDFVVKIKTGNKTKTAIFERSLNIRSEQVDGEERKVLYKK